MADAADDTIEINDAPSSPRGAQELVSRLRAPASVGTFEFLNDVKLPIHVEIGRAQVTIRTVLELQRGSVVSLDKLSGESVDITVGGELLAIGEVIVIQDKLRVRVLDIVYPPDRMPEGGGDE